MHKDAHTGVYVYAHVLARTRQEPNSERGEA